MNQDPKQIAMRYRAMFGTGWQGKLAACMGVQNSAVTRQVHGHSTVQHWFAAYIEFFEVTPRSLWPERWAVLREAADRNSPLMAELDERIPGVDEWPTLEGFAAHYSAITGRPAPKGDDLVGLFFSAMPASAHPLMAETDRGGV